MQVSIPNPGARYEQQWANALRDAVEQAFKRAYARREDVEIVPPQRMIFRSPDGTRWSLGVSNTGTTTWTALP